MTDANCDSSSAFKNNPPLIPIIPPGAAKAFKVLSSISTTLKLLSDNADVSEIL